MRNFIQDGDVLTVAAPYDVASGAGMQVGSFFGVASAAALSGATVEMALEGVYELTALGTDTGSVGTKVYWDNTNKRITTTASTHVVAGALTVAKTNGQTTAVVRLNGAV